MARVETQEVRDVLLATLIESLKAGKMPNEDRLEWLPRRPLTRAPI
jgi:hypothetical protein